MWTAATMYAAGSDTDEYEKTGVAIQTFFLAMVTNFEVQQKAQAEIDEVVGHGRLPMAEDLENLPFVRAVIAEVLRWHPVAPLGISHRVTKDIPYQGFVIPEGAILIPNICCLARHTGTKATMKEIQGPWLASCMGIFFGWAFLAWLVRVWAKLRMHVWTLDDDAICGSMNLCASQIFYIVSLGLCRVSAALFIVYVSLSGPHNQPAQSLAIITAVWTVWSLLAICIRGNIAQPWKVLDGSYTMVCYYTSSAAAPLRKKERNCAFSKFRRWLGIEVSGIFIELMLWGMAAHLVWGIQLKTWKRILIICAFGARLLVVVLVAVRLVFLDPRVNTDPARGATMADFLTETCVHFSIIYGSATTLEPLLMSFYPTDLEPTEASTSGTRSKQWTRERDIDYRLERTILSGGRWGKGR
ncbi:hypothetical protein ACQRIU_005286 [Beauveria bassiana]